jgi:hypothetical protein
MIRTWGTLAWATVAGGLALQACGGCPEDSTPVGDGVCVLSAAASIEAFAEAVGGTDAATARVASSATPSSLSGTYRYDNFGTLGEPVVILAATEGIEGESRWQSHGCEAIPMNWGLRTEGGQLYKRGESERGIGFVLYIEELAPCIRACTPGLVCDTEAVGEQVRDAEPDWFGADLSYWTEVGIAEIGAPGSISIFGERWK